MDDVPEDVVRQLNEQQRRFEAALECERLGLVG
jgi:hypothetical protein